MILKKFVSGVIFRLILLLAVLVGLAFSIVKHSYLFVSILLVLICIGLIVEFFKYITKTNRDLARFIFAIKHEDYSVNFEPYKLGSSFDELHESFREILELYRSRMLEKETHYQQLVLLLDRIPAGIIALSVNEEFVIFNQSAQSILEMPQVSSLKMLSQLNNAVSEALLSASSRAPEVKNLALKSGGKQVLMERIQMSQSNLKEIWVLLDIEQQQADTQMDAWLKLIRILTHEIMNSITSISSLSETAIQMAKTEQAGSDIQHALEVIHNRTRGMISFVEDYRTLTHVPKPNKQWVSLLPFLESILQTHAMKLKQAGISVSLDCPKNLNALLDESLSEQVVTNLILNATHAMQSSSKKQLEVLATRNANAVVISVSDSGTGISDDLKLEVFTPFFSTKAEGSGIGLSLCRQIMRAQGGNISFQSNEAGTIFNLKFIDA